MQGHDQRSLIFPVGEVTPEFKSTLGFPKRINLAQVVSVALHEPKGRLGTIELPLFQRVLDDRNWQGPRLSEGQRVRLFVRDLLWLGRET